MLCGCQFLITKGQCKRNEENNHQAKFLFRLLIRVISWIAPKQVLFFCLHADLQGRPASGRLWGRTEIFPGPAPKTLQGGRERSATYGASLQYQGKKKKIKKQLETSFKALTVRSSVPLLMIFLYHLLSFQCQYQLISINLIKPTAINIILKHLDLLMLWTWMIFQSVGFIVKRCAVCCLSSPIYAWWNGWKLIDLYWKS